MGKGGGKGGKGRVGKFLGMAAGIAFGFAGGAWGFLNGVGTFGKVMYGLSLGMSIGGLFDKQSQPSTPESTFDSKNNQVTSEGTIPIVYGQTKVGGLQTFHDMDIDGKKLEKHVVLCEGPITDIFGITANGYLTSVKRQGEDRQRNVHIFGIRNNKYEDATVEITTRKIGNRVYTGTGFKRIKGDWSIYQDNLNYGQFDKFPKLILSAGGKTTAFFLTDDNTNVDPKYILACNTFGKLYQIVLGDTYISDLQIDGWELENPVICQDSPSKASTFAPVNCYKNTINIYTNGEQDAKDSTVYTYLGEKEQEAPSSYKTTGGYPYMAYVNADLRYTDKMGAGNPTVTAIVKGRKAYDWRTKTVAFTKNPVVCLWEYMTNEVYGAGRYITTDLLDRDSFTDVANYCDEIITYTDPYGVIKSEPRYQLDICLNETKTHLENIQSILNSFLGFLVFSNNKIKLRCERLETPVYAFNDDNIIEKSLSYKSASIDQSPNKFNITYVEPALDYTAVKLIVEDTTNQLPPPIGIGRPVEQDIDFKGVRRQTQCLRLGKIARDIIRLCPITVSFKTGLMASHLEAGDIITVSKTYIDENGEKQELFTNQQARITEIKEEDGTFEITARQYNPSIYDDTFGASLKIFSPTGNNPKEISLVPETVKPVENVQFTQIYRGKKEGIPLYDVVCTFEPPDDVEYRTSRVYVQIISDGNASEWKDYGEQSSIVQIIGVHKENTVNIRIVPIDSKMNEHDESMVQQAYKVISKFGVPAVPINIRLTVKDSAVLTWDAVTNTDVEHYEISLDGNFQNGAMITNNNTYNINLFSRDGRVYVRAVNIDGVAGASAFITYNYPAPPMPIIEKTIGQRGSAQVVLGSTPVMPAPILKIKYRIGGKEIVSNETVYTHVNDAGVYTFTVAYQDYFGNGAWTPETALVIKPDINQELFDKAQEAIDRADAINASMSETMSTINADIDNKLSKVNTAITDNISSVNADIDNKLSIINGDIERKLSSINTAIENNTLNINNDIEEKLSNVKLSLDSKIADNITLFRQEVVNNNNTITATLTQTAEALQNKVNDTDAKIETVKLQTAEALQNSVQDINSKIESTITQTASAIDSKINNEINKMSTSITQLDSAITAKVGNATSKMQSQITQLEGAIDLKISNEVGKTNSRITQLDNAITTQVTSNNEYAKAVHAMSHSPQLMDDPIFKDKAELRLYIKDNQELSSKFSSPSPKWENIDTGGRIYTLYSTNTVRKYTAIGYGGFCITPKDSPLVGKLNGTYIVRMIAKVKPNLTIHLNNNHIGTGSPVVKFVTSNRGTDKVEEYVFYWKYGNAWNPNYNDGHNCGYVYFKDTSNTYVDMDWIANIYRLEVYAADEYDNSINEVRSSITQLDSAITAKVENMTTGIQSQITQTTDALQTKINDSNAKIESVRTQTTKVLQDSVKDMNTKIESVRTQTADAFQLKINETNAKIESTNTQTAATLQAKINNANAKIESVRTQTATAIQNAINNANAKIESVRTQTADALQDKITDTNAKIETVRLQTSNLIDSTVKSLNGKEIVARINQSEGGTRIDGRLLHVTSDAVFDKNVIAKNIDSRSITMDKLAGGTIDLLSMDSSINAGAVHLDKNGMRVSSSNGAYTTYNKDGIRWFDKNGKPFGVVTQMVIGQAYHGDYVRLNWTEKPTVIIIPEQANNIQSIIADDSCSGYVINKAIEVSPKGFRVQSFTQPSTTYCADSQGYW